MSLPDSTPTTVPGLATNLASLANNNAVVSDAIDNTTDGYLAAIISVRLRSGTSAPTAGKTYDIYLVRNDDATDDTGDDNWDETDGSITILNSSFLGSIEVTADTSTDFAKTFDTWGLGALGPKWGLAVLNSSGQSLDATAGNHDVRYRYYTPDGVN